VNRLMEPTGGRRPDLMVNITNDSWYGDTLEPPEHLALAKFRAVEHRRALVRATNTGISALVDPVGRVVQRTRTFQEETLLGDMPKMSGTTVYEVVGDVVGWASLALLGVGFLLGRRRPAA
jgi:apolipoprotein N-acyltransferase